MKLSKREQRLLIIAVVIIVSVLSSKYLIIPKWKEYQNIKQELVQQSHLLKRSKLIIKQGRRVKEQLITVKAKLEASNSLLFNSKEDRLKLKVLQVVDANIKEAGLEIRNKNLTVRDISYRDLQIELSAEQEEFLDDLEEIVYRLSLTGELEELSDFLNQIKQEEPLYLIDNLEVSPLQEDNRLLINLDLKAINRKGDNDDKAAE